MSDKKKNTVIPHVAAPFMILALCLGIITAAAIKPYDKLKVYANLAFMDSLKSDPNNGNGLVIRENDIITDYSGKTADTGEVVRPKFGELYALLRSSAFDLDVPVYWGSNTELFERGACQSSASVVIGSEGNSVVSAHVDTFFAELSKLKEGDTVTVYTNYGVFTYKVRELISFKSTDRKYVVPTDDSRLTLYTCKRDILGNSDQRIGVICEPVESKFYVDGEEAQQ